jgi:hypothetical protein
MVCFRAQYREEYGSSEVVSRMFTCELCSKKVKHTRPVIGNFLITIPVCCEA